MGVQLLKMLRIGAIFKKTIIAILAVVLLINLYLLLMQVISKDEIPKIFGFSQVLVLSGSMHPAIEAGDLLVIKEQLEYKVNDVITYRSGGSLITHRVKLVEGTSLLTQGDANNVADAMIKISQVEGKKVFRIPQLGRIALFLKTPQGLALIVFAGILLFIIPVLTDKRKRLGNDE